MKTYCSSSPSNCPHGRVVSGNIVGACYGSCTYVVVKREGTNNLYYSNIIVYSATVKTGMTDDSAGRVNNATTICISRSNSRAPAIRRVSPKMKK